MLRTRDTRAISLAMNALFTAGMALWGFYGAMTLQWPIVLPNGVTVVPAVLILALKLRDLRAAGRAKALAALRP